MSDLWERCRHALRERLQPDDWRRAIAPLRAWIDSDVYYLWVDRDPHDWRPRPNPAEAFDSEIREIAGQVLGRPPKGVRYLDRPPNREHIINQRRPRERRERMPAEQASRAERLHTYALQARRYLEDHPPDLRACRNDIQRRVELDALIWERAKRQLEREPLRPVWATRTLLDAPSCGHDTAPRGTTR